MQPVRERIVREVVTAVTAAVAPVPVIRQPAYALSDVREAVIVVVESDGIVRRSNDRAERAMTIRVEAVSGSKADPFAAADALIAKAHSAIVASPALAALVLKIDEKTVEYQSDYLETFLAAVPSRYEITYRTMLSDLTIQG